MKKKAFISTKIPNTEFIIAAAILLLLEAFLFYRFLVAPQMDAARIAGMKLAEKRETLDVYRAETVNIESLAARLEDIQRQIGDAEFKLPAALHNEDISILIGQFSRDKNISVESVSFQERQLVSPAEYARNSTGAANGAVNGNGGLSGAANGASVRPAARQPDRADAAAGAGADVGTDFGAETPDRFTFRSSLYGEYADILQDINGVPLGTASQSALYDDAPAAGRTLSLQGVQISFNSEFHTAGPFIKLFEDSERKVRVKSASFTRVREGELKGVVSLEFAALSPDAESGYPGLNLPGDAGGAIEKGSLFEKYGGFIEDNADPTILLLSGEDDIDPDFYIVLKASSSNETKLSYGIYPRVDSEIRSNVNNAIRAKLSISGDAEQFEYVYSLASYQKSETRKLAAAGGKLRMKILSCQRIGDNDNVAVLLDVDNKTELPFEIIVINDDVLTPRFHLGMTKGAVDVVRK